MYRVETVPNLEEAATNKFEAEPHLLWEDSTFNRLHLFLTGFHQTFMVSRQYDTVTFSYP